ncbi:MAG: Gfo/Idh/MocA family oxidoreductase [bacterium]
MLKVGIIGAGLIGNKRAAVIEKLGNGKLIMVADTTYSKAQDLAQRYNCTPTSHWEEVVENDDIDVVIVSTVNKYLAPISIKAMENKKHVLCEKPLGRNFEEATQIYETSKKNNVHLKTGFNHRYHPALKKAKWFCEEGAIGEILFIRCCYGHGGRLGYDKEWRADKELSGGGELLDQGIHAIDLSRWFLGDFAEVVGWVDTLFWDMSVEDNAFCLFKTSKGQVVSLNASWTQWKNSFSFEIFGKNGYLKITGLGGSYGQERLILGKRPVQFGVPTEELFEFTNEDTSWIDEWEDFTGAVTENRQPLGNGYDGLKAMELIDAVYKSSKQGCVIKL